MDEARRAVVGAFDNMLVRCLSQPSREGLDGMKKYKCGADKCSTSGKCLTVLQTGNQHLPLRDRGGQMIAVQPTARARRQKSASRGPRKQQEGGVVKGVRRSTRRRPHDIGMNIANSVLNPK